MAVREIVETRPAYFTVEARIPGSEMVAGWGRYDTAEEAEVARKEIAASEAVRYAQMGMEFTTVFTVVETTSTTVTTITTRTVTV